MSLTKTENLFSIQRSEAEYKVESGNLTLRQIQQRDDSGDYRDSEREDSGEHSNQRWALALFHALPRFRAISECTK